ncbi:hypothetical protein [Rhizobium sp. Rhizsp82]|uniref:hypothetical protein n=1 Tax=Rhizobium sp. Rhizsp82 TaxID=3243057 RepID=UPI0039B3E8EE
MSAMQAFADQYSENPQKICAGALRACAMPVRVFDRSCRPGDIADSGGTDRPR